MRLDRLITLGLAGPARGLVARPPRARRLPVLMYHSISADPEPGMGPYYKVCTSPRRFAEQMQWLADWGYKGMTLSEGLAAIRHPDPPPDSPKPVAITFDDGFRDFHSAAFPVLRRHGFSATMYLPTAFIGDARKFFQSRECLTWTEVRELQGGGVEFGSHTVTHPVLVELDGPAIAAELGESRSAIGRELGRLPPGFAYPYAFPSTGRAFIARFQQALRAAGYETCVTTEIGTVEPGAAPLQLRRLPANEDDDAALLHAKLSGAYDWLHGAQSIMRRLKSLR